MSVFGIRGFPGQFRSLFGPLCELVFDPLAAIVGYHKGIGRRVAHCPFLVRQHLSCLSEFRVKHFNALVDQGGDVLIFRVSAQADQCFKNVDAEGHGFEGGNRLAWTPRGGWSWWFDRKDAVADNFSDLRACIIPQVLQFLPILSQQFDFLLKRKQALGELNYCGGGRVFTALHRLCPFVIESLLFLSQCFKEQTKRGGNVVFIAC